MLGKTGGFQAFLKQDVPTCYVLGCVCHSFALCSSYAVKHLPSYFEKFLKDIPAYFARSSKRQLEFQLIQEVADAPVHNIPKLSQTRWLSRGALISRLLEQWEALLLYFQVESQAPGNTTAQEIYRTISDKGTKPMLLFLNYVLSKMNALNLEFQAEEFKLHVLYPKIASTYNELLTCFVKEEVTSSTDFREINPANEALHVPIDKTYLGGRAEAQIRSHPIPVNSDLFRKDCKKVLVELCTQIRNRIDLDKNSLLAKLSILDPIYAQDLKRSPGSINDIAVRFPSVIDEEELDELEYEWRAFRRAEKIDRYDRTIPQYWFDLGEATNMFNYPCFPRLSRLFVHLTILPRSSASVERVFSHVNCVKTKSTNRLTVESVRNRFTCKAGCY